VKHALDMLAGLPGVQHVMLVTEDGVPVAVAGRSAVTAGSDGYAVQDAGSPPPEEDGGDQRLGAEEALAGLAIGLLTDLSLAVGQMSWNEPRRVVLRAARGTLVLQAMHGAVLLVLLARGLRAEELELPMNGTIARIERVLRSMGGTGNGDSSALGEERLMNTPGPLPSSEDAEDADGAESEWERAATEESQWGSPQ